jgi:hypothetical protein
LPGAKGSRENKFAFLGVEAPAWQDAKVQEYRDISSFRTAAGQDASVLKNVKLFLREPLWGLASRRCLMV